MATLSASLSAINTCFNTFSTAKHALVHCSSPLRSCPCLDLPPPVPAPPPVPPPELFGLSPNTEPPSPMMLMAGNADASPGNLML